MSAHVEIPEITPQQYLADELERQVRHEYVRGWVHAISGASRTHTRLCRKLIVALDAALGSGPCEVLFHGMKVRIEAANAYFYPDVLVTCDERDTGGDGRYVIHHPRLIVEVLSPSTRHYDQNAKFLEYRQLSTLREYVLVDTRAAQVEVRRRGRDGHWTTAHRGPGEVLELASISTSLQVDDLYEGIDLE